MSVSIKQFDRRKLKIKGYKLMKLSSRTQYAIKAMLELANSPKHSISLNSLSTTQNISLSYLEQIFAALRKNQLVKSVRGPGGGYLIAKPMEAIVIVFQVQSVQVLGRQKSSKERDCRAVTAMSRKPCATWRLSTSDSKTISLCSRVPCRVRSRDWLPLISLDIKQKKHPKMFIMGSLYLIWQILDSTDLPESTNGESHAGCRC